MSDDTELALQRRHRGTEGLALFETTHPDSVAGRSQAGLILRHLQSGGTLTALDALDLFGCNRLAARVADLRNKGYNVKSRWLTLANGKRVSEYYLVAEGVRDAEA